jgi:hypothetical protein
MPHFATVFTIADEERAFNSKENERAALDRAASGC